MSNGATDAARVVVFGSANRDHVLVVDGFPQPGETVLSSSYSSGVGGKGANQAVAAARAGAAVVFAGQVGHDAYGDAIIDGLTAHSIDTRWLTRTDAAPTGLAFVLIDTDGANEIVVAPGANAELTSQTVEDALRSVTASDVIVVQCEIPRERVLQIVQGASRLGARVVLNLAPYTELDTAVFSAVDLIVVNESEARALSRSNLPSDALSSAVATVTGCSCIVTLGEKGSVTTAPGGATTHVEAEVVVEVVDTTGAGDTYVGTLAASLARGVDIPRSMASASTAAARAVGSFGAQGTSAELHQLSSNKGTL